MLQTVESPLITQGAYFLHNLDLAQSRSSLRYTTFGIRPMPSLGEATHHIRCLLQLQAPGIHSPLHLLTCLRQVYLLCWPSSPGLVILGIARRCPPLPLELRWELASMLCINSCTRGTRVEANTDLVTRRDTRTVPIHRRRPLLLQPITLRLRRTCLHLRQAWRLPKRLCFFPRKTSSDLTMQNHLHRVRVGVRAPIRVVPVFNPLHRSSPRI